MKKYLIILVGVISLLGISTVKADTYTMNTYYPVAYANTSLDIISDYSQVIKKMYDDLYEVYEENQKDDYPYYIVSLSYNGEKLTMYFSVYSVPVYIDYYDNWFRIFYNGVSSDYNISIAPSHIYYYEYNINTTSYQLPISTEQGIAGAGVGGQLIGYTTHYFLHSYLLYSNFDVKFSTSGVNNLVINNYLNSGNSLTINGGETIPTLLNALDLNIIHESTYTEINLNDYSYVAFSLKNYNVEEEFSSNMYVKGQYCLTPVYDYGLTERKDVISGSKVQACSPYYENFTPVRTYILESDIENHAIYYLKAYDTTRENKVKVDTSIFNIHYITLEEADNPIININGRNYTTIPYDDLTDSATISESEGYVAGASCGVGDFNCMSQYTDFNFSDIFTHPIEFLKNLWTSIAKVFELVVMLISLLPPAVQYFFYISFSLAIIIGLIKIIL